MTVSVVIPTYNRARTIVEAVTSVLAQTFGDLELIVVDDGSTDDTAARIRAIGDRRLRYVVGPHRNAATARNLGVARATGSLISFLDSDDLWRPDKLEHEVGFLGRHPGLPAVFSDLEKRHGEVVTPSFMRATSVFARRLHGVGYPDGIALTQREMFLCLLEEVPIKPSALTMRRAAFEAAGRFDESRRVTEDWEFLLRFARAHRFGYIDRPLAVLRISADSLHIVDQAPNDVAMVRLFVQERRRLRGDAEARAAVRRGLVSRTKHLAWHHTDAGRRRQACAALLWGFRLTGHPGLLARALAALLRPRAAVPARGRGPGGGHAAPRPASDEPLAQVAGGARGDAGPEGPDLSQTR